jgi:taurine--2-oxoglutarate transaminase
MADKVSGKQLLVDRVAAEMMKNGVFVQPWMSHFVIAPPLIITQEEIDLGVKALDDALRIADQEVEL